MYCDDTDLSPKIFRTGPPAIAVSNPYTLNAKEFSRSGADKATALGDHGLAALAQVPERNATVGGAFKTGVLALRDAIQAGDRRPEVLGSFIDAFARLRDLPADWDVGEAVRLCIQSQSILPYAAIWPALLVLKQNPAFVQALDAAAHGDDLAVDRLLQAGVLLDALAHPLLQLVLRTNVIAGAELEFILTAARWFLLRNAASADHTIGPKARDFCEALAEQCFLNEYAFHSRPDEGRVLEQLADAVEARLGAGVAPDPFHVALLACYAPLTRYPWVAHVTTSLSEAGAGFGHLVTQQVLEPALEREIEHEIEVLKPVSEPTSRAVQALYEENPYPRWVLPFRKPVMPTPEVYRRKYPNADFTVLDQIETPEILVAGCGTGLNILTAISGYRSWRLTGVDFSRKSLAHAARHVRALRLPDIRLLQADILDLSALDQSFDIIESIGVLHHLADPMRGWRILADKLRPGGIMQVALYSTRARAPIENVRQWAAAHGYEPTHDGIVAFRHAVLEIVRQKGHRDRPVLEQPTLLTSPDFYAVSSCRDLIFHPQERSFTIPELARAIEALGLRFIGFSFPSPAYLAGYRTRFPSDPAGANLANWERLEAENPNLFVRMYVMALQKPH